MNPDGFGADIEYLGYLLGRHADTEIGAEAQFVFGEFFGTMIAFQLLEEFGMDFLEVEHEIFPCRLGIHVAFDDAFDYVDVVEASSNAEADKLEVAVYPNPVTDELHVSASCAIGTIRLFDMNGRVIYQCEEGGPEHQIDMESYPAGMYFLDVDGLLRKKVVKR